MPTLPNVQIPQGQWVDLYAGSGATVGRQVVIQNQSTQNLFISTNETEPVDLSSFETLTPFQRVSNSAGEGAWAYSTVGVSQVSVGEV